MDRWWLAKCRPSAEKIAPAEARGTHPRVTTLKPTLGADARESWSHGAHGWHGKTWSRSSSGHWGSSGPTHQLDRKDIDKPEKFSGDTSKLVNWASSLKRYLRRHDDLWPEILEKIEAKKCQAITKEFEAELAEEYYWKDMRLFKEQLYGALGLHGQRGQEERDRRR